MVALAGEYDLGDVPELEPKILAAVDGQSRIVLDLTELRYMDSSVLALFVRLDDLAGQRMRLAVPKGSFIRRLLSITSLEGRFRLSESLEQAIADGRSPASE